jgi:DNA-binding IclR family transcriptional regulator
VAIGERLGLEPETVNSHLESLISRGFVVRSDDTYQLSLRCVEWGLWTRHNMPIFRFGRAYADELARTIGQEAMLVAEAEGLSVLLYTARGANAPTRVKPMGHRSHLAHNSFGRAILAHLPDRRVEEIIERRGLPPNEVSPNDVITSREQLEADLDRIRERGFAIGRQTGDSHGEQSVAVPIHGPEGVAIGALAVTAPEVKFEDDEFFDQVTTSLFTSANKISLDLE